MPATDWFDTSPGERMRVRVHSDQVDGHFTILELEAQPMVGTSLHSHTQDEVFHIIEGTVTFEIEGARSEAGVGSIVAIPAGVPHAWCNLTDHPVRTITYVTPGGIEGLLQRMSKVPPTELAELAARYGTFVLGPPPIS